MIEYLMIYLPTGIPVYSKCFGGFCKANATDDILLSGFLSALETFPAMVGGEALKAVEMGNTRFVFQKTIPSGISVAVGLSDKADLHGAQAVFQAIQDLLEDMYSDTNWNRVELQQFDTFKKDLLEKTLEPAFHKYGGFEDRCPMGDQCPMHTTAVDSDKRPIWTRIRSIYDRLRLMMKRD